jgi:RimJ/RimL family protein N-acetyltransferase
MARYRIEWTTELGELVACEPTEAEVAAVAPELAAAYSDPHNAALMGHVELLDADDVVDHYGDLIDEGAHAFLLHHDGALAGDADVREIDDGAAEFAIMVGPRAAQGRGLGTRFAVMLHAFAFRVLGLSRLYVAIVPANAASLRLFDKLGYRPDSSPAARDYADDPDDMTFSVERATFERLQALSLAQIRMVELA